MTYGTRRDRSGATLGDMMVFMATLCVAAALIYPAWSVRGFRATVETAISDVDQLGAAARAYRDAGNRWPAAAPAGEPPAELTTLVRERGIFDRLEYTLGWTSWEVVDSVEAPPVTDIASPDDAPTQDGPSPMVPVVRRVGAITLHSGDESLLAELTAHFGEATSFVFDTTWLMVLPERGQAPIRID